MDIIKFFKKEYIVGLDIGSSSIKLAQFAEKEDGPHLIRADLKELRTTDNEESHRNEVAYALRYLFRSINIKKSKIVVSIDCPQTTIKRVVMPYIPKAELREGIRLQANNYFPFPVNESNLDFEVLGDVVEKGIRKYEVVIAASPIKTVSTYLDLLNKVGIKPSSIIPSSYALLKLIENSYSKDTRVRCFIDIGDIYTELVIFKGSYLVFNRKIPASGSDFTKALTGTLASGKGKIQLTLDEAEKIKRETGIPFEGSSKIIDDKVSESQILSMLRAPLEHAIDEISRCFDYYREETEGGRIESITLFGGGSSLGGLIKFLSEELNTEVKLGDPLEGLKIEKDAVHKKEKISHRLDLAIGAALSAAKGINVLPVEIKEEMKMVIKRGTIEAIVTATILISVLFFMGMKIKLNNFNNRIIAAREEFARLQPQLTKAEAQYLTNKVLADEPQWEDIFMELSNIVPGGIHIEEFKMENNIITMKGLVAVEDGERILADFIITLEKGIFNTVKLVESRKSPSGAGTEFELKCWVDYVR